MRKHGLSAGWLLALIKESLRQRLFCIDSNCPKYVSSGLGNECV